MKDKKQAAFTDNVLAWFKQHGRTTLPWQQNPTAYSVWVSEIMLQQTQVQTVMGYYARFMAAFPSIASLAAVDEDTLMQYWSGLGYYSRARNLHRAAKRVVAEHNGAFPERIEDVVKLPGIGQSTAGAILSFAFGQAHPVLDGNVKRVMTRVFAIAGQVDKAATKQQLWALIEQLIPAHAPGAFNQAMMDIGALICTRSSPKCSECPLMTMCKAHQTDAIAKYPARKPRQKTKPAHQLSLMLLLDSAQKSVLLEKRPSEGYWAGLWSFPEYPHCQDSALSDIRAAIHSGAKLIEAWPEFRHTFTHLHLDIRPLIVTASKRQANANLKQWARPTTWLKLSELDTAAVGLNAPVMKLLQQLQGQFG